MPQNRRTNDRVPILQDEAEVDVNYDTKDDELMEELTGCAATACCNPTSGLHRFIALIFMCLVGFGEFLNLNLISVSRYIYQKTISVMIYMRYLFICYKLNKIETGWDFELQVHQ